MSEYDASRREFDRRRLDTPALRELKLAISAEVEAPAVGIRGVVVL